MAEYTIEFILGDKPPREFANKLKWTGIVFLILGAVAIFLPAVTGLALGLTLGILLIIAGIAQGVFAFQTPLHTGSKLLAALLFMAVGVLLLAFPTAALISLAFIIGLFFALEGGTKIYYGSKLKPLKGWGWTVVSGIVSVLLALLIWAGLPSGAPWIIGLLFGVGLIINGLSILSLSNAIQQHQ